MSKLNQIKKIGLLQAKNRNILLIIESSYPFMESKNS